MAEDLFEQYYTEKLWEAIPSIYRHEDGLAEEPGVLRAVVQVLARQAAIVRRSQDSLWDDQFIEFCNEWAVPYIGDLLATSMLSDKNKRGRRVDVAKTIYYRRRKGTPRILEELISDISGWEGKLVEQFQKLARTRHGLDAKPETLAGKFSGTLPGGWADMRNPRASELTNGPFDEFFHTTDTRKHNGLYGRYSIPKLAFYLYRLNAYEAVDVTPFSLGNGLHFGFDPSGRKIPLFSKSQRSTNPDWDSWNPATEPELPAPIPCRLLGDAIYIITEEIISHLTNQVIPLSSAAATELRKIAGMSFKNESSLIILINSFPAIIKAEILNQAVLLPLLSLSLVEDCGKSILLPDAKSVISNPLETNSILVGFDSPANTVFTTERISAANLQPWPAAISKELAIDAENACFMLQSAPTAEQKIFIAYHYGFSGPVGAGSYERPWINESVPDSVLTGGGPIASGDILNNGITQINNSKTYGPVGAKNSIVNLELRSGNQKRPYLRLESNWILNTGSNLNSTLVLDGLWIGAAGDLAAEIILRGDFECVVIRNCSLDPGGSLNLKNEILHPLPLSIQGRVETLCIESSLTGPVRIQGSGIVEELIIADSIVQSIDPTIKAIDINTGKIRISRSTIFGDVNVHRLEATEALITGLVHVTDTQNGCFRFSAAPVLSRLPHPYESFLFEKDTNHWFTSRRFGDPGYAQLSDTAPEILKRGAENGSEMGTFSNLLNAIKSDGLHNKIDEYMPFGLIPIFINET